MIRLNIHQAKTHLSRYIQQLSADEPILLCKHNVPIAEIRALKQKTMQSRPVGLAKGEFKLSDRFFDPLDDDILQSFEGS